MNNIEEIVKKIADQGKEREAQTEKHIQVVLFDLGKVEFAVEITSLLEIIKTPQITPIPGTAGYIKGIFNLRGKIIVAVDLMNCFKLAPQVEDSTKIIISEAGGNIFGVLVEGVKEMVSVAESTIRKSADLSGLKINQDYTKGEITFQPGRTVVILDLLKILSAIELKSVEQIET